MSRLALVLFGPPRVELDGEGVHIGRRKALALLAFLGVTPGMHSRDSLAALLWPEYDQRGARIDLSRTLSVLSSLLGAEWFCAERDTIGLNPEQSVWLDVDAFRGHLAACEAHNHPMQQACPECQRRLTAAAELYRHDFLSGFSLPDSLSFEEWTRFQAQSLRDELGSVLERLCACHAAQGEYEPAIAAARRWLELDPLREAAHRCLMELYAHAGQGGAALRQYRTCLRVLEGELGVPPAAETTALYERLRSERLVQTERPTSTSTLDGAAALPAFLRPVEDAGLDGGGTPRRGEPVFVAREVELAWLDGCLEAALGGQGKVVFVTGGPGRGKSALMHAFMGRALAAYPDLLVASGGCSAYAGAGDPYLPFREMMDMLTGDVEARWAASVISRQHARRLWEALPLVVRTLLDHGPHLIETLVPGQGLLSRLKTLRDSESLRVSVVSELEEWVGLRQTAGAGLEQSRIFQQLADTLQSLAAQHPLLLTLDDLQWVDNTSASLLFHLGRQLADAGGRVLILGAYRPEEVALDRPSTSSGERERHPLRKVLGEFERRFGQIRLDLTAADQDRGRGFVDAYVDSERNQLGGDFRSRLTERTGGHALFTVELLRAMQERGELVKDAQGEWLVGQKLDWERLPVRVEAVVQERVERLEEEARDLLAVASVEGEVFTAQAVGQVQGLSERVVLRILSRELGPGGHRLVREAGEVVVGGRHLSRFQFGHALFQEHVYRALGGSERRLLHGEIGEALEGLYEGYTDEVAAALAYHYHVSGHLAKAAAYAQRAGELSFEEYAYEEAEEHLQAALAHYRRLGDRPGEAEVLVKFQHIYYSTDRFSKAENCLNSALRLYRELDDRFEEGETLELLGWLYLYTSEYDKAEPCISRAVEIAREFGTPSLRANALHGLGRIHREFTGDFACARSYAEETLRISSDIGDGFNEAMGRLSIGFTYHYQGEYGVAHAYMTAAVQICEENGWLPAVAESLPGVALNAIAVGDYAKALGYLERARRIVRRIQREGTEDDALVHSTQARFHHQLGEDQVACEHARYGLRIHRQARHRHRQAFALVRLGNAQVGLGKLKETEDIYSQALALRREMGQRHLAPEPQAGLARIALARDDAVTALAHVEEILSYLEASTPSASSTCPFDGTDEPLRIYLTCYRILQANADPRAAEILTAGYNLLQARAAKIEDETLRRSYLENVAAHRELVSEWQAMVV